MPDIPQEYRWRLDRARAEMDRAGCDLLILDSGEIMAWLSGFTVSETMYRAIFLPREGDPWFVLRELDMAPCREGGWISDIIGYADDACPVTEMIAQIRDRGLGNVRIGIDFNSISWNPARMEAFSAGLPGAAFIDLRSLSESLRWIKSAHEIDLLTRASIIADKAMAEIVAAAQPGLTTRDAAAIAASCFLRSGADIGETGPIVLGKGSHEFLHGLFQTNSLTAGDVLHVELTPYVSRYGARLMRPVVIGEPSVGQYEAAQTLVALQDEQIAAMKPGAVVADVDCIMRQGALQAGLRDEYKNVTAYTLGLYIRTPRSSDFSRVFLPGQTWMLEENMVFHVYTTARGLGFSETVVVTPEGGQRLTRSARKILGKS
ncbi:M24 family metallopeptidase [Paracoccus onubensis]|uniref:Aminopeptidase P family protein n=1 Tax=Paracoccus onubensis TaxID=1675788 RepID=A0A418SSY4_9RHOB|nr:Xaa-Pro peptidase family protein [Paracoccus onubensis]RJE84085.1 aminopeptidase P family protein [Paracoccus onubensis]